MSVQIGQPAPDFTLYNAEKQPVSLHDFRGKNVVLLFFPQAFTGVCTTELCGVRDSLHDYVDLNAEVLAISVDSLFTLAKFKSLENFNFQLLSDFNKEVAKQYDVLLEDFVFGMKGVCRRAAVVVDSEGIVRHAEVLESVGDLPDTDKIKEVLAGLN